MKLLARSLGAALLLVFIGLLGWRAASVPALGPLPLPGPSSLGEPSRSAVAAGSTSLVSSKLANPPAAASAVAAVAPEGWAQLQAWWASREKVWDLCGVGRVPMPPAAVASSAEAMLDLPRHLGEDAVNAARQRLFSAMEQGSPRAQAAAMLWQHHRELMASLNGNWRAAPAALAPGPKALALVASLANAAESDTVLAGWLLELCRADAVCGADARARWLRADPNNGLVRAYALAPNAPAQLQAQAQPQAQASARKAISQVKYFRLQHGSFAYTVLANLPAEVPLYVQNRLLAEAVTVQVDLGWQPLKPLLNLCRDPRDATARSECEAIARTMVDYSDNLVTHRIGLRMGERLGWPKSEIEATQALVDTSVLMPDLVTMVDPDSCAAVEAAKKRVLELAEKGEMTWLLERTKIELQAKRHSAESLKAAASAAGR